MYDSVSAESVCKGTYFLSLWRGFLLGVHINPFCFSALELSENAQASFLVEDYIRICSHARKFN